MPGPSPENASADDPMQGETVIEPDGDVASPPDEDRSAAAVGETAGDESITAAPKVVPRWALHRRLYDWVLSFAHHRHSNLALFGLSFAESSFFPIPPDVLLAPLCLGKRERSMWFATITLLGSVLGAFVGYAVGMFLIELALLIPGIEMGDPHNPAEFTINWLNDEFERRGEWYVFIAALTPIPFKLLTITSGFAQMSLLPFTVACIIGRGLRFYAVAALFWWIGPKAQPFIDKYFNWLCFVFVVLLVGGFFAIKWMN